MNANTPELLGKHGEATPQLV